MTIIRTSLPAVPTMVALRPRQVWAAALELCTGIPIVDHRGRDTLHGGTNEDRMTGKHGRDTITGGNAMDHLTGGRKGDRLSGGDDDDIMLGENGPDTLFAATGEDTLLRNLGHDFLDAHDGSVMTYFEAARESTPARQIRETPSSLASDSPGGHATHDGGRSAIVTHHPLLVS